MKWTDRIQVIERGWLSSNNVVFVDDDGVSVVDTGYVTHGEATLRLIDEARAGRPLRRVLNTHIHSDHAGGNALLKAHHDCQIWIPPGDAPLVDAWDEAALSYHRTGQQCPRFAYDVLMSPGDTLLLGGEDWRVLPAAGHDHAMVMLWCERLGVLMSADALWQKSFGVIFPELAGVPGFEAQRDTLDLIGQLSPQVVIPGHGAPFTEVDSALQSARSRIAWLMAEPRRNSDNAMKVLLAFKLLEAQRMDRADVTRLMLACFEGNPTLRSHYPDDPEQVAVTLMAQLVRSGAAVADGEAVRAP